VSVGEWIGLGLIFVSCVLLSGLVWGYRREVEELRADRDEDREALGDLLADVAELHERLIRRNTTGSGRHARTEEIQVITA